jgi:hypothetical protein
VNVLFHDRRGLEGTMSVLPIARRVEGGRTLSNHPVPVTPFDCCARSGLSGDCIAIDAYARLIVAAFPVISASGAQKVQAALATFRAGTHDLK